MASSESIIYPPGCTPVSNDLSVVRLARSLKKIGIFFRNWVAGSVETELVWKYDSLARYLASPFFVSHAHNDVKLFTAVSLANILRICGSNHPYTRYELQVVLEFLFCQIEGIHRKKTQKYYKHILGILTEDVSSLYCQLSNLDAVVINLFVKITNIVKEDMSIVNRDLLTSLLGVLILQLKSVPDDLIKLFFFYLKKQNKSENIHAYELVVRLIQKYKDTVAPAVGKFLGKELFGSFLREDSPSRSSDYYIPTAWLSRLWKIHGICSDATIPVMVRLENTLTLSNLKYRLTLIKFLGKLFSSPCLVPVHLEYPALWKAFLRRFSDNNVKVRLECMRQVPLLFPTKDLRRDLIQILKTRDPNSKVRVAVLSAVFYVIQNNPDVAETDVENLFPILERSRFDEKVVVRKTALEKMAEIYSFFSSSSKDQQELYPKSFNIVFKYPKYILLNFRINSPSGTKDRLLVIEQMVKHLIPKTLSREARMKKLLTIWFSFDFLTCKVFMEIRHLQHSVREQLLAAIHFSKINTEKDSVEGKKAIMNAAFVANHLPFVKKKALKMVSEYVSGIVYNQQNFKIAEAILRCNSSVEETIEAMDTLKEKSKNHLGCTVLLELAADLLMDRKSVQVIANMLDNILLGGDSLLEEFKVDKHTAIRKIFFLLEGLSSSSSSYFFNEDLMSLMIKWLHMPFIQKYDDVQLYILKILTGIQSSEKTISKEFPEIRKELISICKKLCINCMHTRSAKWSIRALVIKYDEREVLVPFFKEINKVLARNIVSKNMTESYNSIYCLGYLLYYMADYLPGNINYLISDEVVNCIMGYRGSVPNQSDGWFDFSCLSLETKIKVRFIKMLGQICNVAEDVPDYTKVLEILFKIIKDDIPQSSLLSDAEKSWMRLSAGCSILYILIGRRMNTVSPNQLYLLSSLMTDRVPEVKKRFFNKLTSRMMLDYPQRSLPLDLLGLYFMTNFQDSDDNNESRSTGRHSKLMTVFSRKIHFFNTYKMIKMIPKNQTPENHILVFGLLFIAHDKQFNYQKPSQHAIFKKKIQFFLKALTWNLNSPLFYKKQLEMLKEHGEKEASSIIKKKLWALCDLALTVIKKTDEDYISEGEDQPTLPMDIFEPNLRTSRKKKLPPSSPVLPSKRLSRMSESVVEEDDVMSEHSELREEQEKVDSSQEMNPSEKRSHDISKRLSSSSSRIPSKNGHEKETFEGGI